MKLIESLNWRYATKKYSDQAISDDQLSEIIDAINLSASSAGMQPYRLFVIENPEIRKALAADSFNTQIAEASHLLVFAAYTKMDQNHIDDYIKHVAVTRNTTEDTLIDFKRSLENSLLARTDEEISQWSAKQAYIALGTGLIAAATLKVDATPMEGFNAETFDKALALEEKGLKSAVLLALGYRDSENDLFAGLEKVRVPKEEFVTTIR